MATDEAPWSFQTAEDAGKTHGVCCKHKSNGILKSQNGLGGLTQSYINDMSALIYEVFESESVLDEKIRDARKKYGHNPSSREFIDSIDRLKNLLCATLMQYHFTFGHCTTSIGESWNARMKGHGELKKYLATANLFTLINLIDRMARAQDIEAVKILKELRQLEMRWSSFFQHHYDQYKMVAGTDVVDVSAVELEDGSKSTTLWEVRDIHGKVSNVNLETRIVHLGHVYTIPTCDCGKWCSVFVWCPCIIRGGSMAALVSSFKLESVCNVHPFHLLQLHPMWQQALKELNVENYKDFPHLETPEEVHLSSSATLASDSEIVSSRGRQEKVVTNDLGVVMPARFYNQLDTLPAANDAKVIELKKVLTELIAVAVTRGNDATFRVAHCRMMQAVSECEGNIDPETGKATARAQPTVNNKRISASSLTNRSTLNIGMRNACGVAKNGRTKKKQKLSNSNYEQYTQDELKSLLKAINTKVSGKKSEQIQRLEDNAKAKEVGEMNNSQMQATCAELGLATHGDGLALRLRLLYNHFGSAPVTNAAVAAAMAPAPTLPAAASLPTLPVAASVLTLPAVGSVPADQAAQFQQFLAWQEAQQQASL